MNQTTSLTLSTSPQTRHARKPRLTARAFYRRTRCLHAGKEQDSETGLYYYGARYLDSRTGRWLSGDPAVSDYVPSAPINDEARKQNESLPGMGGVFNYANLHVYHYAGNNPVKYVDPNGKFPTDKIQQFFDAPLDNLFQSITSGHYTKTEQTTNPFTAKYALRDGFYALPPEQAAWHRQGEGNEYNLKMVHQDGREAVYNKEGNLVTDTLNLGTRNTVNPGNIGRDTLHALLDVGPYLLLGNSIDDNPGISGMIERKNVGLNPPPIPADYKDHWKDFYPRQNEGSD